MKGIRLFTNGYQVKFSAADPIMTLLQLSKCNVALYSLKQIDAFTIQFDIKKYPNECLIHALDRFSEDYSITEYTTLWSKIKELRHRYILLLGLCMLAFLTCYLPTRILFVQVKGNTTIPAGKIIAVGKACGIDFAASRRDVRSEKIKNRMIEQLPQLEWVGINTYGCVAGISVREGEKPQSTDVTQAIGNIIASRDGVIISCTTLQGTQICQPGQAVSKGQLLVSGYTDCGIYIQGTMAKGDILAATTRELHLASPNLFQIRCDSTYTQRKFHLVIGNKLIKFSKDSGISTPSCVKIKKEYPLMLPGGFVLPISLIEEQMVHYEIISREVEPLWAAEYGHKYLNSQMIAGKIISKEILTTCLEGVTTYEGKYFCTEMIGQTKIEETMQANGYD